MKASWERRIVSLGVMLAAVTTGWAQAPSAERSEAEAAETGSPLSNLQPALVSVGFRAWEHDNVEGIGDLLLPVYSLRSGLLFLNPRTSFRGDENEMNLGVGYRHLLAERNMILGINAYYDRRETEANNRFNQAGFGLEFLSEWVDARANYYLPDGGKEKIITTVSGEPTEFSERSIDWDAPYGAGNAVYQRGLRVDSRTRVTPYTQFIQYEQGLEGFDCEVGVRLPIPVVQDWSDVKVFAGYYRYDSDLSSVVDGWKGRLEVRALPALLVDAELFEDDDLNGSSYYIGARLQAPFDLAAWSSRKNPFAGTLDGFKPTRRGGRPFDARLTEMVMRDPRVQTRLTEPHAITPFTVSELLEQTQKKLFDTVNDSLIYVDKDNVSGIEDGTFEHPFSTIGKAIAAAGGNLNTVYVWDSAKAYKETVVIDVDGLSLIGSGTGLEANGGYRFASGVYPLLEGPALADLLPKGTTSVKIPYATVNVQADDVLISGLSFWGDLPNEVLRMLRRDLSGQGLFASKDIDPIEILLNAGVQLSAIMGWDANNLTVAGNVFRGKSIGVLNIAAPLELATITSSGKILPPPMDKHTEHNLIVAENRFEENAIGVLSVGLGYGFPAAGLNDTKTAKRELDDFPKIPANVSIIGNTFQDNLLGVGVAQIGGGLNVVLADNSFNNDKLPVGVAALIGNYDGPMNAAVIGNTVRGNHTVGMGILQEYGALNAVIADNDFEGCQLTALAIEANAVWAADQLFKRAPSESKEPGDVNLLLSGNRFAGTGRDIPIPDWLTLDSPSKREDVLKTPDVPAVLFALVGNNINVEVSDCVFDDNRGGALVGLAYAEKSVNFAVNRVTGKNNGTIFGDSEWIDDIPPDWDMDDEFPTLGSPFDYSFLMGGDPGIGKGVGSATVTASAFENSGKIGAFIGDLDPLIDDILNWRN